MLLIINPYIKLYTTDFLSFFISLELYNSQPNCKCSQEATVHFLSQIDWTETVNMRSLTPPTSARCSLHSGPWEIPSLTYLELRGLPIFRNRNDVLWVLEASQFLQWIRSAKIQDAKTWIHSSTMHRPERKAETEGYLCPSEIQTIIRLYMQNQV